MGDYETDDSITREERLQKLLDAERPVESRLSGMRTATDRYMRRDMLRGELDRERARGRTARR
jgi:hypothetical protein